MQPAVMMAQGGQINYILGYLLKKINNTWMASADTEVNEHIISSAANANNSSTVYDRKFMGGTSTYWPAAYANHKPCAFFKNKLYYSANNVRSVGELYLGRFDGSGVLTYDAGVFAKYPWKSGKGTEFLSPSGATTNYMKSSDAAFLVHNGNLIIVAATWGNPSYSWDDAEWGWYLADASVGSEQKDRVYRAFVVDNDDKKIMSKGYQFLPDAGFRNDNHMCDAIGFGDDVYFATYIDIGRIQGGSGNITLAESTPGLKSAKSFAIYPNGGYTTAGASRHGSSLLCLSSSGVIKKIAPSGIAGVTTLTDLSWMNSDIRNSASTALYGTWARNNNATAQPIRAPLLMNFNHRLHAFIPTAASGFRHFYCSGQPSGTTNWHESTSLMPGDFKYWDGNMFGFVDDVRNKMVVAHCSMSEIGLYGYQGGQKGAGGISVYSYDTNNNWNALYRGVAGWQARGLVPYNNIGPDVLVPSGSNPTVYRCSDYAIIEYTLFDHYNRSCDASIEYSIDDGLSWFAARRFKSYAGVLLGSGLYDLPASHNGTTYDFYWDYVNDVGFNADSRCMIRITPKLSR